MIANRWCIYSAIDINKANASMADDLAPFHDILTCVNQSPWENMVYFRKRKVLDSRRAQDMDRNEVYFLKEGRGEDSTIFSFVYKYVFGWCLVVDFVVLMVVIINYSIYLMWMKV